jgi:hexosaminidase
MNPHSSIFSISNEQIAILPGLQVLVEDLSLLVGSSGTPIKFTPGREGRGFHIVYFDTGVEITYQRPCDAYRALASLVAGLCPSGGEYERECAFESVGVMLDVSRNGVLKVGAVERTFRRLALMGVNNVQLYTEDVYTLPDEPFFGYARGAYTPEELRAIDAYGLRLGIEVIPCIQTLGHLEQILQWNAYSELMDTSGVLLAEHEGTYDLVAKMLDRVASCFTTRKVHIGMDEAHGIGSGRYRKIYGKKRTFDILSDHLRRVTGLCIERGLDPMIWSDMFFRIGSASNDYYDLQSVLPDDVIGHIPKEVAMVYWDYYHEEPSFYDEWIARHRRMGKEPILAIGAWTWGRFWACMERVHRTNTPAMAAARRQGLRHVFTTAWGDDGAECHPYSMFASIQYFTEFAYNETADPETLEKLFAVGNGSIYSACVSASELDTIPRIKGCPLPDANFGKWILWHDPILSFLAPQIPPEIPQHYQKLADQLVQASQRDRSDQLHFAALLARVLAGKAKLHLEVRNHYQKGDTAAMRACLNEVLKPTLEGMESLWNLHREVWNQWYKPFGWEVIDARYATVSARLRHLGKMLRDYLEDPSIRYAEFEYDLQRIHAEETYPTMYFTHRRLITPSASS